MQKLIAMACVVTNKDGEILLLKRATDKKFYPEKWAFVGAAPLKGDEGMHEIARREMRDEIGQVGNIIKEGSVVTGIDNGIEYEIFTFLAVVESKDVVLNEEHTEYVWVNPDELNEYDTAPKTGEIVKGLLS